MLVKEHGQSIIKGSLILLIANMCVKIIGAFFKIPLVNLLGNEGMGNFNAAYNIYAGLFIIATAGLPVAVSKMVSQSVGINNLKETKRIYNAAYIIFLVIGILGSSVLFFFADELSVTTGFEQSNIAIKAIAPAILFVSLMSVYRGFFQGMSDMIPTAISEVVEALGKLIIGYILAYMLISRGTHIAAAGAIFGVTAGTVLSFLILMVIHQKKKKSIYADISNSAPARNMKKIVWELTKIAVPVTISASVFTLTNMIDYVLIGQNLSSIKDFLVESPTALYGKYTGKAVVLFNLPPTLVMSLCLALVPAISRASARKDKALIKTTTAQSLKMTLIFAIPCSVALGVLATPILNILFATSDAVLLLRLISPAVMFVSLVLVTNAILQATGNVMIPVVNIAMGGIAKIIINSVLVSNPAININGAPIGTAVCYFIYMALNLHYIRKITKAEVGISLWVKPLLCGCVMGVVAYFGYELIAAFIPQTNRINYILSFVFAGGLSGIAYLLTLLSLGSITADDIAVLPKGEKIAQALTKMKLLKK